MKNTIKTIAILGLMAATSACTMSEPVSRVKSMSEPLTTLEISDAPSIIVVEPNFNVAKINVSVPQFLTVSEANTYKPRADIVWRGDTYGDRYAQVKAVMQTGLDQGASNIAGNRALVIDVQVKEFHAQTEKVRYTFGGEHEIVFTMILRDAGTGAVLNVREVDATFDALGGDAAVRADNAGRGQKVRIIEQLAKVITQELQKPFEMEI